MEDGIQSLQREMRDLDVYCRLLTVYIVRVMIRVMNAEVQMRVSVVARKPLQSKHTHILDFRGSSSSSSCFCFCFLSNNSTNSNNLKLLWNRLHIVS